MKDGRFETQAEIYQALLDGKKITYDWFGINNYIMLLNGMVVFDDMYKAPSYTFSKPEYWRIYEEPKSKRKLYRRKWVEFGDDIVMRYYENAWAFSKEKFDEYHNTSQVSSMSEEWEEKEIGD